MEKMRLFENSIQPLLEQVRFNTNLISVSAENEVNPEKFVYLQNYAYILFMIYNILKKCIIFVRRLKELKPYDLIANIRRLSLDKTENSQIFGSFQ